MIKKIKKAQSILYCLGLCLSHYKSQEYAEEKKEFKNLANLKLKNAFNEGLIGVSLFSTDKLMERSLNPGNKTKPKY